MLRKWRWRAWSRSVAHATSKLIDCQVASTHLATFGAREVSRSQFVALLRQYAKREPKARWGVPTE